MRVELDRLAAQYAERLESKTPTTRQLRHVVGEALAEIEQFRGVFGERALATYFAGDALAAETRTLLNRLESELRAADVASEGRDAPEIAQDEAGLVLVAANNQNAHKAARARYWDKLARLWNGIAPARAPRQRLIDFVVACTGTSEPTVRTYFDRKRARIMRGG